MFLNKDLGMKKTHILGLYMCVVYLEKQNNL